MEVECAGVLPILALVQSCADDPLKRDAQLGAYPHSVVAVEYVDALVVLHGYEAPALEDVLTQCCVLVGREVGHYLIGHFSKASSLSLASGESRSR